jgi:hypothetical protein
MAKSHLIGKPALVVEVSRQLFGGQLSLGDSRLSHKANRIQWLPQLGKW